MIKIIFIILSYPILILMSLTLFLIIIFKMMFGIKTNGFSQALYALKYPVRAIKR